MQISAIVAMGENRVIGRNNQLPWRLPADLQHFKTVTMGKPIIMGRKTYFSIGRPLPGRLNIVLSRDLTFQAPGCVTVSTVEAALAAAGTAEEVFVIGGEQLYREMLPFIQKIYLTIVHHDFIGDAHFPEISKKEWHELTHEDFAADEQNPYPYSFLTLLRIE